LTHPARNARYHDTWLFCHVALASVIFWVHVIASLGKSLEAA